MNEPDIRFRETYGGYFGEFRMVHRSKFETVCVNGVAQIYPSPEAALAAAWSALRTSMMPTIVGTGIERSSAKSAAERLFGAIIKRGKKIPVVRR